MNGGYGSINNSTELNSMNYFYMRLSLADATTIHAPYAFTTQFGNKPELNVVKAVKLVSACVPNVSYNISASRGNSTFTYNDGVARTATIADGQYDSTSLITALTTAMNTASSPRTVTITLQQPANKYNIAISSGTISVGAISSSAQSLNASMGFIASATGANITASELPDLSGDTVIYIHSATFALNKTQISVNAGGNTTGQSQDVNMFAAIPVTVAFGAYQSYNSPNEHENLYHFPSSLNMSSVDLTFRNAQGGVARGMSLGMNPIVVLKCYY